MLKKIRTWAKTHTSKRRYSPVGVTFHWGMTVVIVAMLAIGWLMGRVDVGAWKLSMFDFHMVLGLVTLVLSALRLVWRILIPGPVNDADALGFQTTLSHITHGAFYLCFIGLPLSGYLTWSAFAEGDRIGLGIFSIAPIAFDALAFETKNQILYWANATHHALIWLLLLIIPVHAGAALKHHFWDRHDVLVGMLPVLAGDEPPAKQTHRRRAPRSQHRSKAG